MSQWLENDFLSYLDDWEAAIHSLTDLSKGEKNRMMLSAETLEGLRITGIVIISQITFQLHHYVVLSCSEILCGDG